MKRLSMLFVGLQLLLLPNFSMAQGLDFQWAFSSTDSLISGGQVEGNYNTTDINGNVYIVGVFNLIADFDPSISSANLMYNGEYDIFLAKYDILGNYLWAIGIGSTKYDKGTCVAVDSIGNVYITGYFQETVDFDPSAATANLTSTGNGGNIFLAKYDVNGNYLWAKNIGGSGSGDGHSLVLDHTGNICLAGSFSGTLDFDPSGSTANLSSSGNSDVFLAKYDTSGNYNWAIRFGGNTTDSGNSIAVDSVNNIIITGSFRGVADFDPSAGIASIAAAGSADIFLAKYDANGNYLWAKAMGGVSSEGGGSLVIDNTGSIYLTGGFSGLADFDPSAGTANLFTGSIYNNDIFIAKYDANGNYVWAYKIGGADLDFSRRIVADNLGHIYLTGGFNSTIDFDPSANTSNFTATAGIDLFLAKYDTSGAYIWAMSAGSIYTDYGNSIVINPVSGNICMTGYFSDTVDFDSSINTINLVAGYHTNANTNAFNVVYNPNGQLQYGKVLGDIDKNGGTEAGYSITTDASNNIYVTGVFSETVDFDPSTSTANLVSNGNIDVFLAKYDSNGNYLWAKKIGGRNAETNPDIVIDYAGNICISGIFKDTVDFDPSASVYNLVSSGLNDVFFAKYDSNGNFLWAKRIGGIYDDHCYSIAVDSSNNIYIGGFFKHTVDFDPSTSTANLSAPTNGDGYFAKYDANGNYIWANRIGNAGADEVKKIVIRNSSFYLVGTFNLTVDFDPSAAVANQTGGYFYVAFAKYDLNGNYVWAKSLTTTIFSRAYGISLDAADNIYLIGAFGSTTDFDPSANTVNYTAAGNNVCLVKYDSNGTFIWVDPIEGNVSPIDIMVSAVDDVLLIGTFRETVDFDPSANVVSRTSIEYNDIFIAKYSPNGIFQSVQNFGGIASEFGLSICQNRVGEIYATGGFGHVVDFDSSPNEYKLTSVSSLDLFVVKYEECLTATSLNVVTACDSYTWIDGNTYRTDTSIMLFYAGSAASGCDSMIRLNLIIHNSDTSNITQTACDSFSLNGQTYTLSGIYTQMLTNVSGCDSLLTLNLTINVVDTSLTVNNMILNSNAINASYQWVDCNNGNLAIVGETGQSFSPTMNGDYAVVVTENGCIDTSSCYNIFITGLESTISISGVNVYPNPIKDQITIDFGAIQEIVKVKILAMDGKLLQSYNWTNVTKQQISLERLPEGFYLIEITLTELGRKAVFKVAKI